MTNRKNEWAPSSALDAALRYAEIGWHVHPCGDDKKPLTEHGLLDATTEEARIVSWWRRWPNAQVAISCGVSGLCVIDLDIDLERKRDGITTWSRLKDEHGLDGCGLVAITPRGGRHYVYMRPENGAKTRSDIIKGSGIDVRCDGGYIVAPSPASPGRRWEFGDPVAIHADGSTDLVGMPKWVQDLVATKAGNGSSAGGEAAEKPLHPRTLAAIEEALPFIDSDAHDTWVQVGMALKSTDAGEQAFQLWDTWSQRSPRYSSFKIETHRKRWRSFRSFRWDGSEITIGTLFHLAKEGGWVSTIDQEIAAETVAEPSAPAPEAPRPIKPFPLELIDVPGVLGDMVAWMLASSTKQQPALCLASAIVSLGALLGRRVASPSDLRTNIYALGIGETACGKDPGIKLPQVLFAHAGLSKFIGPGEWKSDTGMRSALTASPSHVCLMDEFAKTLDTMSGKLAPAHIKGIKHNLLKLFSSANGVFLSAAYADRKLHAPTPINEPNLGIYGTGVPGELFSALDRGAMADGFLNRFLIFFVDDQMPKRRSVGKVTPPATLVEALKKLEQVTRTQKIESSGVETATNCRTVPMDEAATEMWEHALDDNERRIVELREKRDLTVDLWVRFGEHVAKLALIRSVCDDPAKPIEAQDVAWAIDLVVWCTERTMAQAGSYIADSRQEADTKKVLRAVVAAGPAGLTSSELTRATRWLTRTGRKDIVATLLEGGDMVAEITNVERATTDGMPRGTVQRTTYVASSFRQAEAAG